MESTRRKYIDKNTRITRGTHKERGRNRVRAQQSGAKSSKGGGSVNRTIRVPNEAGNNNH